jgi:uncharacterized RDD family membrane protein YckC
VTRPLTTASGKRASRTGPSEVMKAGTWLVAPPAPAAATWGLGPMFGNSVAEGLVPPIVGCARQLAQLVEL